MNTFLLKINSDVCPLGIGTPSSPEQWNNAQFITPPPRSLSGASSYREEPNVGDRVHVWVNETRGGKGYTGYGTIAEAAVFSGKVRLKYSIRLERIRLVPVPIVGEKFWRFTDPVTLSVKSFAHSQLLWLGENEAKEFEASLENIVSATFGSSQAYFLAGGLSRSPDVRDALIQSETFINEAFRERIGLIRDRTRQSQFRRQLLNLYGECCVTGCSVDTLLDAAHIVPLAIDDRFHDDVRNGLLLRADIHRLFDDHLIGLDPTGPSIVIADVLYDSEYSLLADASLNLNADGGFLERRFEAFLDANSNSS